MNAPLSALALVLVVSGSVGLTACAGSGSDDESSVDQAEEASPGTIIGLAGKCVDIRRSTRDGARAVLWDCNGSSGEGWTYTDGTFVGPGGKCLDIQGDVDANGTAVQLWDCNGTDAQKWTVAGGTITSVGGHCLDVSDQSSANGAGLQLWDCWGGDNQKWAYSGSPPPVTSAPDASAPEASTPDASPVAPPVSAPDSGSPVTPPPTCASTPSGSGSGGTFDPNAPAAYGMQLTFDDELTTLSAKHGGDGTTWETNFYYNGLTQSNSDAWLPLDPAVCNLGETPFSIEGGILDMAARPTTAALKACGVTQPATGAFLDSFESFSQRYGYFETRAQVSDLSGTIFAFWLLPESSAWPPEIDAPEILGNSPTSDFLTNHSTALGSGDEGGQQQVIAGDGTDLALAFHTYGVLWDSAHVTWFLDGKQVGQVKTQDDENVPMYMILDFGVGSCGDGWADCVADPTGFAADAKVDWVHVWGLPSYGNPAVAPQAGFTGGNGSCASP